MTLPDVVVTDIADHYHDDVSDYTDAYLLSKLNAVIDGIITRGWESLVSQRIASGTLPLRHYKAIVVRIAARVFANPEGFKKENEGQYGYERGYQNSTGEIMFSPDDIRELTGITRRGSQMPGVIRLTRGQPTFGG